MRIARRRSIDRTRLIAIAALPRQGAIIRQTRRCLIAHNGVVSMRQLRAWCYPQQDRRHWHYWSIARALRKLEAQRIGWAFTQSRDTTTRGLTAKPK